MESALTIVEHLFIAAGVCAFLASAIPPLIPLIGKHRAPSVPYVTALLLAINGTSWSVAISANILGSDDNPGALAIAMLAVNVISTIEWTVILLCKFCLPPKTDRNFANDDAPNHQTLQT